MKPQPRSNEAAGRHTPCIYTAVCKVARYETQASSKAELVTYVADVRVMSAIPRKQTFVNASGMAALCQNRINGQSIERMIASCRITVCKKIQLHTAFPQSILTF